MHAEGPLYIMQTHSTCNATDVMSELVPIVVIVAEGLQAQEPYWRPSQTP